MNTLRNLLVDLDGLGKTHKGAQLLCDYTRFNTTDFNRSMTRKGGEGKKTLYYKLHTLLDRCI
jgi:hypothetical protein